VSAAAFHASCVFFLLLPYLHCIADNGLFHGEHGLAGKWFPHEESIRIPLIIKDPRMGPDRIGTLEDAFTLNIDLATTILGVAGLAPNPRMQGRDIADLYLMPDAKATWRKEFFYEHPGMGYKQGIPESTALVRKDFKYMKWPQYNYEQLFDLKNDPLEHNDIVNHSEYADLLAEMRAKHDELKKSVI
jgi:arylsulfatase